MALWKQASCCRGSGEHSAAWCHTAEHTRSPSSWNLCMSIWTSWPSRARTNVPCWSREPGERLIVHFHSPILSGRVKYWMCGEQLLLGEIRDIDVWGLLSAVLLWMSTSFLYSFPPPCSSLLPSFLPCFLTSFLLSAMPTRPLPPLPSLPITINTTHNYFPLSL